MIMSLKVTEPVTRNRSIWLRIWISGRVFEPSGFIKSEKILNVFVFDSGEFLDQQNTYLAAEGLCTIDVVYESLVLIMYCNLVRETSQPY